MSEPAWVPLGGAPGSIPPGVVTPYAGASAPTGYLLCDGAAVSRTTYAALYAAIGTAYGVGDGSTTFNVPDMQGRIPVGKGTHAAVDVLGDNDGSALANRQPGHRHTVTDPGHTHNVYGESGSGYSQNMTRMALNANVQSGVIVAAATGISIATAGASAPLDTPAYVVVNFIVKT